MILVTGGTGLLGAHLLYKLVTQGKDVKAIYRDSSKFEKVKNVFSFYTNSSEEVFNKITWIRADINDVPALDIASVAELLKKLKIEVENSEKK